MTCVAGGHQLRSTLSLLVAMLALTALPLSVDSNHTVHGKASLRNRLKHREEAFLKALHGTLDIEIVIARYAEVDMGWLQDVPEFYRVTIYNKGGDNHAMPDLPDWRQWDIIDLPNVGRESNTFAEHLVRRYDSLASYTIFSQAEPLVHNQYYLELLRNPTLLGSVQAMSRVYILEGDPRFVTPAEVVPKMSKHLWYRSERASLRTLNSVWYHDEGTVSNQNRYREEHELELGTNLIRHHFGLMGLPDWVPEEQEVGSFAFGGQVGFERSRALQHPREVYEKLLQTTTEPSQPSNGYVIEHMWLMLFGGSEFRDV